MTEFEEKVSRISEILLRAYLILDKSNRLIAQAGIERHFKACNHIDIAPDYGAIREIIKDASQGVKIW